jgi:hypothetical protein
LNIIFRMERNGISRSTRAILCAIEGLIVEGEALGAVGMEAVIGFRTSMSAGNHQSFSKPYRRLYDRAYIG